MKTTSRRIHALKGMWFYLGCFYKIFMVNNIGEIEAGVCEKYIDRYRKKHGLPAKKRRIFSLKWFTIIVRNC